MVLLGTLRSKQRIDLSLCFHQRWLPVHPASVHGVDLGASDFTAIVCPRHGQTNHGVSVSPQGGPRKQVGICEGSNNYHQTVYAQLARDGCGKGHGGVPRSKEDAIVHGTCTARDYLKRVFVAEKRNISVVLNMV